MSCRHDLANGTCNRCYPNVGTIEPGPEDEYEPNMEGVGAVTKEEYLKSRKKKAGSPPRHPTNTSCFPCTCSPMAKKGEHCTAKIIRCNARLNAIREWSYYEPPFDGAVCPAPKSEPIMSDDVANLIMYKAMMNYYGAERSKASTNQDSVDNPSLTLEPETRRQQEILTAAGKVKTWLSELKLLRTRCGEVK